MEMTIHLTSDSDMVKVNFKQGAIEVTTEMTKAELIEYINGTK